MASDFSPDLIQLQRAATAAWDAVEAHRLAVDADRKSTAVPGPERHSQPVLRSWTDAEDARHSELMGEVTAAQEALRAAMLAGPGVDYDAVQGLKAAARGE